MNQGEQVKWLYRGLKSMRVLREPMSGIDDKEKQFLTAIDAMQSALDDAVAKLAARERCIGEVAALYEQIKSIAGKHPASYDSGRLDALDIAEQRLEAIKPNKKGTT